MRRTVVLVVSLGLMLASAAHAQVRIGGCADRDLRGAQCGTVTVPVDHGPPPGAEPSSPAPSAGTLDLAFARYPATGGAARGTIVFLAGGPGQAALPYARELVAGPLRVLRP